ncbi:uncharacterized protein LOC111382244 [Olea europaea var. sylvestris]|uniref:uncharacterized protein LOC111382244 n=1 Tax=Olea europaea var. sylvestris TaxID=158386 RepID=UPI000C1D2541|nr:uncharacterized protein LOC111382244 [Olea europaea var. sylvestris]
MVKHVLNLKGDPRRQAKMNGMDNSAMGFVQDKAGDSDSDTNSDEAFDYYQPISTVTAGDDDGALSDQNSDDDEVNNHYSNFHPLSNGYASGHCMGNGFSSLDLSDEDEEEERSRETSESERAIERAFREDERRRQAPLTSENASRVMEAMRGVSFGGFTPDWAGRIPEDRWIDQLRRLRQSPSTGTGTDTDTASSTMRVE